MRSKIGNPEVLFRDRITLSQTESAQIECNRLIVPALPGNRYGKIVEQFDGSRIKTQRVSKSLFGSGIISCLQLPGSLRNEPVEFFAKRSRIGFRLTLRDEQREQALKDRENREPLHRTPKEIPRASRFVVNHRCTFIEYHELAGTTINTLERRPK